MFCFQWILFVFNLVFLACGAALAGVGIWTLTDPTVLETYINLPVDQLVIVSYIATVAGAMMLIIGFIGCCGALMSNPCLLCLFSIVVTILLIAGAAAAVVGYVATKDEAFGKRVKDYLFDKLEEVKALDKLQENLKCCGVMGPGDYPGKPPASCDNKNGTVYQEGCWQAIKDVLSKKVDVLAGMGITLAILGTISVVLSVVMMCSMKQAKTV